MKVATSAIALNAAVAFPGRHRISAIPIRGMKVIQLRMWLCMRSGVAGIRSCSGEDQPGGEEHAARHGEGDVLLDAARLEEPRDGAEGLRGRADAVDGAVDDAQVEPGAPEAERAR